MIIDLTVFVCSAMNGAAYSVLCSQLLQITEPLVDAVDEMKEKKIEAYTGLNILPVF
jgi:hypothetical protein